jgi:hypothetical protein
MQLKSKIIITFNKFYSSLIKDLKASNDDIKSIIKKNYKIIDKLSEDYIVFYNEQFGDILNTLTADTIDNELLNDKFIAKDITVKSVIDTITNDTDRKVFWNYFYILTSLLLIKREFDNVSDEESEQTEQLFNKVLSILSKVQSGDDYQSILDDILDDDIKILLSKIDNFNVEKEVPNESPASEDNNNNPFGKMENSMICNLAKEISNEIDVSNIKVDKPEDILKLMDFTASNNIVGDIIKKVSSKIHDKISSGELKQEDLFSEAMNMMSMMNIGGGKGGSMGGMADMMSSMMGGGKGGKGGDMADMMSSMMGGGKGGKGGDMADMMSSMMGGGKGGKGGDMADMMSGMANNPMMAEAMKAMKKGKATIKPNVFKKESARERLRAKLNARKNKDEDRDGYSNDCLD